MIWAALGGILWIGFLCACAVALAVGVWYSHYLQLQGESEERRVRRPGGWLRVPEVLIHTSCPVDEIVVRSAVSFWVREHGYAVRSIRVTDSAQAVEGAILVVGPGYSGTAAATRIAGFEWRDPVKLRDVRGADHYCRLTDVASIYADGQIHHAVIAVPRPGGGLNLDLLLIHRFGHAFGLVHVDSLGPEDPRSPDPHDRVRGHVMSCLMSEAGWSSDGIPRGPRKD